ncbi:MAG: hypothetical protein U1E66_12510 [Rhodospirillales bacterium]
MTGSFSRPLIDRTDRSTEWPPAETVLDRHAIENVVARANRLRSQQFGIWVRKCFANWRSLLRRPGRPIPKTYRSSKAGA